MPRQDETVPSSQTPTEPFPCFMNLPPELHILIANFLIFPDLVHLKLTCAYFNDLIPPLSHHELLQAELTDFALARDVYTCRYCLRLRPAAKFADRMLRRGRGRYGRDAERRFCVECGLMPRSGTARYGPGAQIVIQGVMFVICMVCREFAAGMKGGVGKGIAICQKCWEERLIRERACP
ncbi:hypothetical protein ANOM_003221 [Aspergillus nomiae NRRL 13137]|uniref:F-box domain-containing protein n=1 Tax=Aspergillus nomiae NRRL (strain ATCC 15546 / NRRL 13137 / CBS 260.88 / M93) TaxID=1509407 RepID=A0A0L1JAS2_ASPN3|nr:uncharacterized protein ANOM_003221 [Aspergillus nomiae NRRL 13137]KNG88508.1 hypothetical protein ANOM_003221 [Aspergillus nomiae NRRL 13137]